MMDQENLSCLYCKLPIRNHSFTRLELCAKYLKQERFLQRIRKDRTEQEKELTRYLTTEEE